MNFMILDKEFEHEGLKCVVVKQGLGHRCGYVGIPKGHKLYGKDYCDDELDSIEAHGGITYAEGSGNYPIKAEDTWWFGFDTAHYFDNEKTQSLEYCTEECKRLAEQLKEGE